MQQMVNESIGKSKRATTSSFFPEEKHYNTETPLCVIT
jgi:hypothetical protein